MCCLQGQSFAILACGFGFLFFISSSLWLSQALSATLLVHLQLSPSTPWPLQLLLAQSDVFPPTCLLLSDPLLLQRCIPANLEMNRPWKNMFQKFTQYENSRKVSPLKMKQPQLRPSFTAKASILLAVGAVRCNKAASKPGATKHTAFESCQPRAAVLCYVLPHWRGAVRSSKRYLCRLVVLKAAFWQGVCRGQCQGCCQPLLCNQLAYARDLERCLSPWRWLLSFNGLPFVQDIILYHNPLKKVYSVRLVYHVKDDDTEESSGYFWGI